MTKHHATRYHDSRLIVKTVNTGGDVKISARQSEQLRPYGNCPLPELSTPVSSTRECPSCKKTLIFRPFLPQPCLVLDIFAGSGTTGVVALRLGRSFIGIELNPKYVELARKRITEDCPMFNQETTP